MTWLGLFAPAETPKPIVDKLNGALTEIFKDQDVKRVLDAQYITGIASTSAEAKEYFLQEITASKDIIESIGLKPE